MPDTNDKKLFLLDAFALIYRAHFAFIRNPRINSKGMNTSAVFGFTNSLLDILNNEQPSHIGIVYDTDKPTFRHTQFTEYKANRQEQPEDISIAIPIVQQLADAMGIPNLWLDGYEADDVVGTLAKKAAKEGFTVYMMTPDKDYAQLVEENIIQYKPGYMGKPAQKCGLAETLENWEISEVCQVIDILGLMGDNVDNIPGIPGVGEKTAKKLIQEYGSIENLIERRGELKGKLKERVDEHWEQALMSKQLATIDINVPIDFDAKALQIDPPDKEALKALFAELEFRAMAKRILGEEIEVQVTTVTNSSGQLGLFDVKVTDTITVTEETTLEAQEAKTLADVPHNYKLIRTKEERQELAKYLSGFNSLGFDTETSELSAHTCKLVGFSFSPKAGEAYYIANSCQDEKEDGKSLEEFRTVLENPEIEKVGQNIKYDILVLLNYGVKVQGTLFDTMLAHYLIEPDMRHNMDLLAGRYLQYAPVSIETLIGKKGKKQISMADLEPEQISDYACEDADIVVQLREKLEPQLGEVNALKLFREVELPLVYVLAGMEAEGVKLDTQALKDFSLELRDELLTLEQELYKLAGSTFNINSPMQLGEILFDKMKLDPKAKRTSKSKQYSTGEDVLSRLAGQHEIAQKILDYRGLQKLKSTYVDSLPLLVNKRTGRLHTTYNQAVAATGRLSSTDPNLQNIPIRTERGREIRKAFIPRDEHHVLLSADYSQIELRLIAEISGDEGMIQAFVDKEDIHTSTSAKIFGVTAEEVTPEMRRRAKMVNFGIIYGISAFGLAQRLGINRTEASDIIKQYNAQYPRINEYLHNMIEFARKHGYVETLMGRRRYLRDINSGNATQRGYAERNAINAPIQGTAADMIKVAMINIHKEMNKREMKSRMILQVHDELVFDALRTEVDELKPLVEELMKNALKLRIPIDVEMGTGDNWLQAH